MKGRRAREREYQQLLELYRERRSRLEVGLEPWSRPRSGPRPAGLRHVDVDEALQGGAGVYQKVESGRLRPSPDHFLRIARLLKFSRHHLLIGHLDLFQTEPVLPAETPSPHLRRVVDGQREMTCALTPDGRVVASNGAFAELFPAGEQPVNLWRWALFSEEARRVLLGWEKEWAPNLLTELKLARHRYPTDSSLCQIYADSARDPRLRQISESDLGLEDEERSFRHAINGEGRARFMTTRGNGASLLTILFEAGL